MQTPTPLVFTEKTIEAIFGNEDAGSENLSRLRAYYFRHRIYDQIISDLSYRILVGHKGIGKSALFRVALAEDRDAHRLSVLIKPEDLSTVELPPDNYNAIVKEWKRGLYSVIAKKILESLGASKTKLPEKALGLTGQFLSGLIDTLKVVQEKADLGPAFRTTVAQFLKTNKIVIYLDDLDRGWNGKTEDIVRLSALCNAAKDLAADNEGLQFRLALRSDVYFLIRKSEDSTDKIEGSVSLPRFGGHERKG